MSTKKKLSDSSVRCYEVSDPTLHPKGHTIYKITQRTIQAEALDANVQEVVVWRRYNDIKRLYKALFHLHHMLHRKEEFPPFSRSKVFGRFDQTVIIDRMRSCQDLLNFVGQRTYLVNSQAFQQFFEGGEKLETDISKCELLKPTTRCQHEGNSWATDSTNSVSLSDASEDDAGVLRGSSAEVTASSSGDQLGDSLGGVWQYRQSADEISLHDDDDDLSFLDDIDSTPAQTDITDIMDDSPCDVVLQKTDIDLFDPLAGRNLSEDDNQCSNEWLLSATPVCDNNKGLPQEMDDDNTNALLQELEKELVSSCGDADRDRSDTSTGVSETGVTPGPGSTDAGYVDLSHGGSKTDISSDTTPKDRSRSSSTVECGKGDLVISPVHPAPSALSFLPSGGPGAKSASPTHSASMQQTKRSEVGSVTCSPRHQGGLVTVDLKQKADYIFQAAHHISLAQQCEASGNYFMAFNYFKSGVGILLTGVQLDENEKRRDIVRKKTAKYLMKAESLHTKYLSGGESTDHWDTRLVSTEKSLQPDVAFLCGPVSELANYRVLGVIDKVQLVMDKVTETTYVIKVLYKSCREPVGQAIVPTICPFMVRLYRYYETSSAIYLLLQHATGGHLWSYVSGYLNQTPQSPQFDDHHGNRQSPNQVGEEITNIKTETSNGDARVPQECAESYKKLFTENSMPSSEIDNGNSNAAPARSQCRKSIDSLGLDKSPDILVLGNTQHPLVRRVSSGKDGTGFGELLKGSDVPVEQFSINSFDSDVTPGGARYNSSTTDYIETVPELSESVSPTMSPSKHATSPADEDVFIERSLDNHLTEIRNGECLRSTPAGGAHDDAIVSPQHRRGQVSMDKIVDGQNTVELDNEPSIYDRPQSTNCDTGSLDESNMYSDSRTEAGENNNHKSDNIECTQSPNTVTESKTSPDTHGTSTDKPEHRQVFRMPSQERSLETRPTGPVRKRSRTGRVRTLSSVFGDLDLADDNGRVESPSLARLPETCVRQWIVEMLVAVTRLHQLGIVCRDLRPANVLLGERGHVILSYFSRWSCVDAETLDVLAVSQLYAAPEVSQLSQEVSDASDWWSVGALMYELLTGRSLASCHPSGINSHTCLMIPDHVSPEAQSLLQQLLKFSPSERLGSGEGGVEDIRAHPFFADVHWPSIS